MAGIIVVETDSVIKILTLIVAAIVGWFSIRANRATERKTNIEAEIRQQELYKLMSENKERKRKEEENAK